MCKTNMDGNLQHIIIPAKLNTAAPDTNTLTFLILENTMGPVIEPIQFPNVNIDAIVPHTFRSIPYIVCNAIGIKVDKVTVLPKTIIVQIETSHIPLLESTTLRESPMEG